jgi:hypothetical protein
MEHIIQITQKDLDKVKDDIAKKITRNSVEGFADLSEAGKARVAKEAEHNILYNSLVKEHGLGKAKEIILPMTSPCPQIYDVIALKMYGKRYKALCSGDCSRRKVVEDFEAAQTLQKVADYTKGTELVKDTYVIEIVEKDDVR